jgi:hypothetical protein
MRWLVKDVHAYASVLGRDGEMASVMVHRAEACSVLLVKRELGFVHCIMRAEHTCAIRTSGDNPELLIRPMFDLLASSSGIARVLFGALADLGYGGCTPKWRCDLACGFQRSVVATGEIRVAGAVLPEWSALVQECRNVAAVDRTLSSAWAGLVEVEREAMRRRRALAMALAYRARWTGE